MVVSPLNNSVSPFIHDLVNWVIELQAREETISLEMEDLYIS